MKRAKHKVRCIACNKDKILFETKEQAERFLKFNGDNFKERLKPYYCLPCGGWHLTKRRGLDRYFADKVINAYNRGQNFKL